MTAVAPTPTPQCAGDGSTLGDAKGLDVWTYFPSVQFSDVARRPRLSPTAAPVARRRHRYDDGQHAAHGAPPPGHPGQRPRAPGSRCSPRPRRRSVPRHRSPLGTDGSYTYTPAPGYIGPDSFDYTITDDFGQTASATVVTSRSRPGPSTTPGRSRSTPRSVAVARCPDERRRARRSSPVRRRPRRTARSSSARTGGHVRLPARHDFSGTDTFTYGASLGTLSDGALVTITVTPTAADDDRARSRPTRRHGYRHRGAGQRCGLRPHGDRRRHTRARHRRRSRRPAATRTPRPSAGAGRTRSRTRRPTPPGSRLPPR